MVPTLTKVLLIAFAVLATAGQIALGFIAFVNPPQSRLDHPLIRLSAIAPVLLWFMSLLMPRRPLLLWMTGACLFPIHVLIAFHLGHHWSHAHAFSRVETSSGFGYGLFVSYAFGIVWLFDAAWRMDRPASYYSRSRWVNRAILGFLAFIVFNATVVYGGDVARWFGIVSFIVLMMNRTQWRRNDSLDLRS